MEKGEDLTNRNSISKSMSKSKSKSKSKSNSNNSIEKSTKKKAPTVGRNRTLKRDKNIDLKASPKSKPMNIDGHKKTLKINKIKDKTNYKDDINDFKQNGVDTLNKLSEKQLAGILDEASKAYYNETPIMTDNEFDIIKEYMENKYPNNKILKQINIVFKA